MLDVLIQALSLVAIIALGVATKRWGWASVRDFPLLSKLVLRVTLPCALITSFQAASFSLSLLWLSLVAIVANLAMQVAGYVVAGRQDRDWRPFGVLNVGSYNIGAFATPYISGFMGPQAVVYASLFDVGNSFTAAGTGYAWAMSLSDSQRRTTLWSFLRHLFSSVIFDTYLALIVLRAFDITLPAQVLQFTGIVGGANTFLAMLMIGIGLQVRLDRSRYVAAATWLGLRYLLTAAFVPIIWFALPFARDIKVVLVMLLFAPIAAMIPGMTHEARGDVQLSTLITSVSIVVGVVAMPVVLALLS